MGRPRKQRPFLKGPFIVASLTGAPVGSTTFRFSREQFFVSPVTSGITTITINDASLRPEWTNIQNIPGGLGSGGTGLFQWTGPWDAPDAPDAVFMSPYTGDWS